VRFLEYVLEHEGVWFCTGKEIADHWRHTHSSDVTSQTPGVRCEPRMKR
jgi:hypothetical protein